MPRSQHEADRDPADRATTTHDDSATDTNNAAREPSAREITDEGLGLSPRSPTDEERRGSRLTGDQDVLPAFKPTGQRTGSLGDARTPSGQAEVVDEEPDLTTTPHTIDGADARRPDLEPSLVDQELLTDPMAAMGGQDDTNDPVADGNEVYVPPTDPVISTRPDGDAAVLGGFSTSAEEEIVPRRSASDGQIGDEAIVDAVQSALRHDAATADLEIDVTVEQGVVRLRGTVPGPEDAENAEAVASRVRGVVEIVDELGVAEL